MKVTWKLIGMMIDRKGKSNTCISKLICDNKCYTDKTKYM